MKGESIKTLMFRSLMNLYPMYFGTGGKVIYIKKDWTHAIVKLKLGVWTRNYVGTIFGGSQFAAADPIYMLMLMNIFGKEFVVWDKGGSIEFKRPSKASIKAEFVFLSEELSDIRKIINTQGSYIFKKTVSWTNSKGEVISVMERTLYIATKKFYRQRQIEKGRKI